MTVKELKNLLNGIENDNADIETIWWAYDKDGCQIPNCFALHIEDNSWVEEDPVVFINLEFTNNDYDVNLFEATSWYPDDPTLK